MHARQAIPGEKEEKEDKNESPFDAIYRLAKALDKEGLKAYLEKHNRSVDPEIKKGETPAMRLAFEGNIAAVRLLREEFKATPGPIARGFARAKNFLQVQSYHRLFGPEVIDDIAQGWAEVGDHKRVKRYRKKYHASTTAITKGYAYAANHKKVEEYEVEFKIDPTEIAEAYVQAELRAKAGAYRDKGADKDSIAFNWAFMGIINCVEIYRVIENAAIGPIVEGFALAGNHQKVEEYSKFDGVTADDRAWGYALGGDFARAENELKSGADPETVLAAYCHINAETVDAFSTRQSISPYVIAKCYAEAGHNSYARYHLAQALVLLDDESRVSTAEQFKNDHCPDLDLSKFLPKVDAVHRIMFQRHWNFKQALLFNHYEVKELLVIFIKNQIPLSRDLLFIVLQYFSDASQTEMNAIEVSERIRVQLPEDRAQLIADLKALNKKTAPSQMYKDTRALRLLIAVNEFKEPAELAALLSKESASFNAKAPADGGAARRVALDTYQSLVKKYADIFSVYLPKELPMQVARMERAKQV